jgi:hypothetical protein
MESLFEGKSRCKLAVRELKNKWSRSAEKGKRLKNAHHLILKLTFADYPNRIQKEGGKEKVG